MKILIVDDSAVMRRIHRNILVENKVPEDDLLEAQDGQAALQIATEREIGLFLVDWNMPKLNGFQFVQTLRSMEQYAKTPIIMITSEAAKYNVVEAIKVGVTNYVVKPIQGHELWKKLKGYIESGGGA